HEVPFSLRRGRDEGRDWLELQGDPREPGSTRYFRESEAIVEPGGAAGERLGPAPAGPMWIDLRAYATRGRGCSLYQLRPAGRVGIDGVGVGGYQRDEFDEWRTEALTSRMAGDRLEVSCSRAGQQEATSIAVRSEDGGARWLELARGPRDFWRWHRYRDVGPS